MFACYLNIWILILGVAFVILEYPALRKFKFIFMVIAVFVLTCFNTCTDWHLNFISYETGRQLILSLVAVVSVVLLVILYYAEEERLEILLLHLMVMVSALVVVSANNLVIIYLGTEIQVFSLFILITMDRHSIKSAEAGMKYFILSSLSSGMFLLGLAFMFTSNVVLDLNALIPLGTHNSLHLRVCYSLIVLALLFKLAIFPLHFWVADIYEGSAWEVLSVLATLPKLTILAVLVHLVSAAPITLPAGVLSVVVGTLGALNQTKLKRLIAYSGVSHLGFILIGLSFATREGLESSMLYLIIYVFTILSLFLLVKMSTFTKEFFLIELSNVFIRNRILGLTWVLLFFSIAGIPPLAGFISKWIILRLTLNAGYVALTCIVVVCSAVAAGYYLRITKLMYFFQFQTSSLFWSAVMRPFTMISYPLAYLLGLGVYLSLFLIFNIKCLTILLYISANYMF